ncbi:MAG: hypothetical protein HY816_12475 [Candidatus Wallbacteria bacterium]|nr:hypothetical protein [Candidatus Wallbacteria bacterium]
MDDSSSTGIGRARPPLWRLAVALAALWLLAGAAVAEPLSLRPQAGLCFERVLRSTTETTIVKPRSVLTQTLEAGSREVGRVMDVEEGQIRIASKQVQSALKVNGQARQGTLPGAGDMKLRVYSPDGQLLRSSDPEVVAGDLRELAIQLPTGELSRGATWEQELRLATGPDTPPVALQARLAYAGPTKYLERDAHEIRGDLRLSRQYTPEKLMSTAAAGKFSCTVDAATGLPLRRVLRFKMDQVREDDISKAHVKAGGKKLGVYVDMTRDERATYVGMEPPPALRKP